MQDREAFTSLLPSQSCSLVKDLHGTDSPGHASYVFGACDHYGIL